MNKRKNHANQNKNSQAQNSKDRGTPQEIVNEREHMLRNGLTEALLGSQSFLGGSTGNQLSQVDTLFKNLRYYLASNLRQMLSQVYVEIGLVKTIVDIPVEDALRGGIDIQTDQLDEDEIKLLKKTMEREQDLKVIGQAEKWNRLFGGSAVLIVTNQPAHKPLDVAKMQKDEPIEFKAIDMWELYGDKMIIPEMDGRSINDNLQTDGQEFFQYYSVKVHKSRIMILKGLEAPSFVRPRLRGWGLSVVETLVRSINQYLKATDLSFEVLDEFKVDIFKIKNLTNTLLRPDGETKVQQRVGLANRTKNYQNAIVMDAEDDYDHKQLSFAGLAETMEGIRLQIASDMRMPLTKLFGTSSAGFSSGEDDIENYNAMIESDVRTKIKFDIMRMVEFRCQQLFGMVPEDLDISFESLRVLSTEQEENVKTMRFNRVMAARAAGEIDQIEFREACNRDDLLPIRLGVDNIPDVVIGDEDESVTEAAVPVSGHSSAQTTPTAKV